MQDWFNQHLDTLVTVILAIATGFFSFVFAIAIIILKHRERIKGIEGKLDEINKRVNELEQQIKCLPETIEQKDFKKLFTSVEKINQTIYNLRSINNIPIKEYKVSHKPKKKPKRYRKKSNKTN